MDKLFRPFGPIILEQQLSIKKINWLNNLIEQAPEEVKSKSIDDGGLDMQKYLSGNITGDQIAIPKHILFDSINGIMPDILNGCEKYNDYVSETVKEYNGRKSEGEIRDDPKGKKPEMIEAWVNRTYAGDFNPFHRHYNCDISGVLALMIPENMYDERGSGELNLFYGEDSKYNNHHVRLQPEAGTIYYFPEWMSHMVNPFRCEGERRTMAFNVSCKEKE